MSTSTMESVTAPTYHREFSRWIAARARNRRAERAEFLERARERPFKAPAKSALMEPGWWAIVAPWPGDGPMAWRCWFGGLDRDGNPVPYGHTRRDSYSAIAVEAVEYGADLNRAEFAEVA